MKLNNSGIWRIINLDLISHFKDWSSHFNLEINSNLLIQFWIKWNRCLDFLALPRIASNSFHFLTYSSHFMLIHVNSCHFPSICLNYLALRFQIWTCIHFFIWLAFILGSNRWLCIGHSQPGFAEDGCGECQWCRDDLPGRFSRPQNLVELLRELWLRLKTVFFEDVDDVGVI